MRKNDFRCKRRSRSVTQGPYCSTISIGSERIKIKVPVLLNVALLELKVTHLSNCIQPSVQSVTRDSQIRFTELVTLGPAKRHVTQSLLNDSMEPSK